MDELNCNKDVKENVMQAPEEEWPNECFKCSVCSTKLNQGFFKKDGVVYCKTDYFNIFADTCQSCSEIITGPVMVAGAHKFHPECFKCSKCSTCIGDGESFALLERTELYCGICYTQQMTPRSQRLPFSSEPHSIKLVKIPAHSEILNKKIRISGDCCLCKKVENGFHQLHISDIVPSKDLIPLQIGDKILEVNGSPLKIHSLQEIDKIVKVRNKHLQLTVEHEPTILSRSCSMNFSLHPEQLPPLAEKLTAKNVSSPQKAERKPRASSLPSCLIRNSHSTLSTPPDLSRTLSFRIQPNNQRIFRPTDLVLGKLLGKGFFGQVFLVTHRHTGEEMVMKELYRLDEEAQQNFLKEVAVLRSLQHRNVLRFVGILYKDKKLHLLTEYIRGGTLKDYLQNSSLNIPWLQRINFALDIAVGMAYLHSRNIIHRDLNSSNCLVRNDKSVVVADFGLARVMKETPLTRCSGQSIKRVERRKRYTVVGNPYWMAPEMMMHKKYDERVDIFSFGIIVCEIISRIPADPDFMPRSSDFGLNHVVFMQKFCESCPEPFYQIAFKCCNVAPEKRPSFAVLEEWLSTMCVHFSMESVLPEELLKEIRTFIG